MIWLISIYCAVIIANALFAIFHRCSFIVIVLSIIAALVLMAENSQNPDLLNYSTWYANDSYPEVVEKGYVFLSEFIHKFGFTFSQFRWIIFSMCFIIIGFVTIQNTRNVHLVIFLFFAYQVFFDYVQIRSTLAVAILILALFFYSRRRIFLTICLLALSISLHKIMILYPVLFVGDRISKKYRRFAPSCLAIVICVCIIIFMNGNQIPFFDRAKQLFFLADEKYQKYFTTKTRFGFVFPMTLQIINIFLSSISINTIRENPNVFTDRKRLFCESVHYLVMASSVALPLVMINEEFIRIFRNCNILLYIVIAMITEACYSEKIYISYGYQIKSQTGLYVIMVLLDILLWIVFYTPSTIIHDLFTYNSLFC